ncbi:MAG: hypothetical protein M1504_01875 [Candidatus Marsarchaeota archaeon]|nr:hypothetical protein [Candidatus Marsarchaeota archaeon]
MDERTKAYAQAYLDLNVEYEIREKEVCEEFLRRHAKELTPEQIKSIRNMNGEHIARVEIMDRNQQGEIGAIGIDDLEGMARTFNVGGERLMKDDQRFYDEVIAILNDPLRGAFKKEVAKWIDYGPNNYVERYAGLNKEFGLDALNEKLGINAPTSTKPKKSIG